MILGFISGWRTCFTVFRYLVNSLLNKEKKEREKPQANRSSECVSIETTDEPDDLTEYRWLQMGFQIIH